jgi:hypothetical protein
MKKTSTMPLWVFLAFSSIESRKGALIMIWSSLAFTFYCIPWVNYIHVDARIARFLLIDDWTWFAFMLPMTLWYWVSMKWIDRNGGW